jgi:hypothetical protein
MLVDTYDNIDELRMDMCSYELYNKVTEFREYFQKRNLILQGGENLVYVLLVYDIVTYGPFLGNYSANMLPQRHFFLETY